MNPEFPLSNLLAKYKILLGSKSPRRQSLLSELGITFDVVDIKGVQEVYPASLPAEIVPQYLSNLKFKGYQEQLSENELLITADTVVINDDKILGKPANNIEATEMLLSLANHTHQVITGVTIGTKDRQLSFSSSTNVTFGPLDSDEISYYINKYAPLDKAGAYGIQEWIGMVAVESIDGSFYNVMGLPVYRLYRELLKFRF